ncbi:GTP cyclohydrolase 1 type 2 [Hoyosella rhizosphaerae]|uniref:GTP cyclohydrolase 1 type 2 homolog n=1 Tax=Hoyosella rhizosphaerae TaxID=1755582 RepID=A0A916UFT8_9ACTN|nr:Nif3-like dinuclear metal center hexameric protein [Hoyosella rhizosphaerae]GGC71585.1 GTP cyclohydrolase 1 type 2 [Hoyosella rhizosphaerae]
MTGETKHDKAAVNDTATVTVGDVVRSLEVAYPPQLAESWDSVGLVCGNPDDAVTKVLLCVDVTTDVVEEAINWGAELIVAHHPLLLRGVDSVATNTPKGVLLHRLIRAGCALFTAHTNADSADPGVSDALADALGITVEGPIAPKPERPVDKWVVFVPSADTSAVGSALFESGAGSMGDYSECAWSVTGTGQFRPLAGANPTLGTVGDLERVVEDRLEVVAPRNKRDAVRAALRSAHPYEEPAFDVFEHAPLKSCCGLGRVGALPAPETLREFTRRVANALPATTWGVRAAGDPERLIHRVAVCGGAGDSYLAAVSALGVDAYVTSDLRHHPTDEHLRTGGPALIDVSHWASEYPWCAQARSVIDAAFSDHSLETRVCAVRTDPWTVSAHPDES